MRADFNFNGGQLCCAPRYFRSVIVELVNELCLPGVHPLKFFHVVHSVYLKIVGAMFRNTAPTSARRSAPDIYAHGNEGGCPWPTWVIRLGLTNLKLTVQCCGHNRGFAAARRVKQHRVGHHQTLKKCEAVLDEAGRLQTAPQHH